MMAILALLGSLMPFATLTGTEKPTVPDLPEMSTVTSLFSTFPMGLALEPLFGVR